MTNFTTYSGRIPETTHHCFHVNRGRFDVDTLVSTINGVTTCSCSWCGAKINVPEETPGLCDANFDRLFQEGDTFVYNGKLYQQGTFWAFPVE
ncbi:MAG: hypothetical protein ACOH2V_00355 [Candidatus Saccharimonadaceae bacterium]